MSTQRKLPDKMSRNSANGPYALGEAESFQTPLLQATAVRLDTSLGGAVQPSLEWLKATVKYGSSRGFRKMSNMVPKARLHSA